MKQNTIKNILFIIIGSIALGLGIMGIVLPILPTTPFLLLASFCYLRSSRKLYHWLINHKVFGVYIYNYITYKAITKRSKVIGIFFLWFSLIISIIITTSIHLRIFLILIGICVTIHLFTLKTLRLDP